jgi:hypothetical protein
MKRQFYQSVLTSLLVILAFNFTFAVDFTGIYSVGSKNVASEKGHYATLKAACDDLSKAGNKVTGNCTFYITSDITEECTGGIGVGLAVNPGTFTITFKPAAATTATITFKYPSDGNDGPSGAFIIGLNSAIMAWADLKPTKNIVFDGSNTDGGKTRDLTIQNDPTAHRNGIPFLIVGDVTNVVVKNCKVYNKSQGFSTTQTFFNSAIVLRTATSANTGASEIGPSNITIDNCHLSANFENVAFGKQGFGTYSAAQGTGFPTTSYSDKIVVKNCLIEGKGRGLGLHVCGSIQILNNEIQVNMDTETGRATEAIGFNTVVEGSTIDIIGNKITKISNVNDLDGFGSIAINLDSAGTYNINNNVISGFAVANATAAPLGYAIGVKITASNATAKVYNNTFVLPNLSAKAGKIQYACFVQEDGTLDLKNNIIVNQESDFASYGIIRVGTKGKFTSNYNDIFFPATGKFGQWAGADCAALTDWKTKSTQDANSISVDPKFVSATDFHLAAGSPAAGTGVAITEIKTDIEAKARAAKPSMGAYEGTGAVSVETFKAEKITIYPNPATENVSIKTGMKNVEIEISDVNGKLIYKTISNDAVVNISLSKYAKGLYFIKVKQGDEVNVQKLIKE